MTKYKIHPDVLCVYKKHYGDEAKGVKYDEPFLHDISDLVYTLERIINVREEHPCDSLE